MMRTLYIWLMLTFACCVSTNFSPAKHKAAKVIELSICPAFGGQPLALKHKLYISSEGDSLYIDAFRFYVSDVCLLSKGRVLHRDPAYHLVDAGDTSGLSFKMPCGAGDEAIDGIRLTIGVDSLSNVSGAMDGDLDPAKGMYWAWNSGFINAKMEGRSSACRTLHHAFEFHIGGYRTPYNTRRTVNIALKKTVHPGDTLCLDADASQWLRGIHLKDLNSVLMPSKEAMAFADQYSRMFNPQNK